MAKKPDDHDLPLVQFGQGDQAHHIDSNGEKKLGDALEKYRRIRNEDEQLKDELAAEQWHAINSFDDDPNPYHGTYSEE
tara:strand:- start:399 stop:635 length:237 start_codon:yes stop_codon:yes gene_type:complete